MLEYVFWLGLLLPPLASITWPWLTIVGVVALLWLFVWRRIGRMK